ncbi:MAG: VCBS repeat-containing protein [Saprospiraceae bacterium]|nr:VCBS repeat-containing protein [Saprospiraceae bacterium]
MDDDVTAGNTLSSSQIYFEDMNGDNATDIVFIKHSTGLHRITYVEPSFDRSNISILQVEAPNIFTNVFGDIAGIDASIKQISFVDIDGNGLPEVFVYRPIDGVNWFYTRVVVPITLEVIYQKTNGPLVLAPGIPANTAHRFLDINGDGNAELLWAVRVNNQFVMKINKMLAPIQHYISDTDGLIQYGEVISRTFNFDNGDSTSIFNLNLFFTELNGDGLPDFVSLKSGILTFYINDGKFNFNQRGTLTIGSIDYPVFADLNSDGNFDILKLNFANGINSWLLNNGYISLNGNLNFIVDPGNNSLPSGAITGSTPRFLSYRKNSYVDVLFLIESTNIANQRGTNYWWINNFKPSYRVNEVTNGLGLKSKVLYTTTDNIEVYKPYLSDEGLLPPPVYYITNGNPIYELAKIKPFEYTGRMPVVYEYQLDNGFNGINKLTYKYQKSVMDRSGAGFRGFRRVIIKDETSGLITVKNHKLTKFGIMSDTFNYTMYSGDTFAINTTYSIDSIESKSFTNTSAYPGNVIVTHEYESYFQYNKLSEKKNYDLDGTFASQINSFNVVDSFGNVTMNVIDYNDGFVDSLLNQYTNNTALWHLGRLTRSELRRYAPNAPPIKRVSAFEYHPTKGAMVKEIVEPDLADTFRIEKNYLHDAFGNVFSERIRFKDDGVWKTRGNTTQFDIRGRFIVQQTNDLGHISKASYNNLFGHKKSVTDINGIISYTYFDDFGRIKRAEGADSSWTETMYRRCNGDCPPQAVTFTIETYANGRTDKSYFDKMGREVKSETLGFKGRTIFTQNKYNFSGRLISTSDPYYSGETPKFSTISYDKLGREILREETGGSISSKTYYGLGMKVVNPIGQTKTSYTFANGKVQQSIDNQGNELQFRYDAQGNTVKTILPTGHEVISEFNILNQQTKLIDPDLGTYIYRYNAIGEIKYQRDPKGNEVFMKYDTLGRLIERKELEDVSYFTYDSATNGIGMLAFKGNKMTPASSQYITHFTYQYDYLSRPVSTTYQAEGDSVTYTMTTEYDTLSRPVKLTYPTINGVQTRIRYTYDGLGYNDKIIDDITNVVYWSLDSINSQGQLTKYTLGNGNKVERMYDMEFDWINEIKTTTSSNQIVQHLQYDYDFLGNVQWRKDLKNNMQEYFSYDNLNRLTQAQVTGYNAIQMQYDILGNITSKSDLGIYHYNQNGEGPHVVSSIDLLPGKCIPSASTVFTMNSFNKATSITSTHHKMDLLYSVDKQRYRQQYYFNNQWVKQKDFILDLIEREKSSTGERTSFYIKGSEGVIAVKYHQLNNDSTFYHYWLKDNLGSLQTVIGSNDSIVEVLSFDAWGQRRFADGKPMQVGVLDTFTNDRGFTGHEHLDFFDLINMNGRIYDAILGRFTSPDPFVQESFNIQSYNRYAYVFNNPLAFTDPSGYWGIKSFTRPFKKMAKRVVSAVKNIAKGQISKGLKDLSQAAIYYGRGITGWDGTNELGVKSFGQENWNTIVVTAATIAATMALGPGGAAVGAGLSGALAAGAASGFVGGALGTILAGGDVGSALKAGLKGAAIGAVSAGLTYGVGSAAVGVAKNVNSFAGYAVKTAGDGVVSGAISEYQGGSFKDGFASGAISSEIMSAMSPLSGVLGSGKVGRSLMSAAISGTASDLSGGKFFNGAASGAMSVMFGPSAQKSEEELVKEALGEAVKNMMADMENPNRFKNEHGVDTRMAGTRENVDCAVAFGSIFLGAGSKIAGTAISMQYHLGSVVYDGVRGNNLSGVDQVMSIIGYFPGPGGAVSAAYFCGKAASDGLFGTLNK